MRDHGELRKLPSVNEVLNCSDVARLVAAHGQPVVKYAVQAGIDKARRIARDGGKTPDTRGIVTEVTAVVKNICGASLKPVINATGVILHTNLGRAALGPAVIDEMVEIARGYSSLEFDLVNARRGERNVHVREILRFLTGAEDVLVVNNNAAGIVLALNTLTKDREAIISRGELVEIGGSFRIPEIMAASGARMVEVGTTNRTRLSDYEDAVTGETAMFFKAHKSNYVVRGFTEEVSVKDLADLAHSRGLPMMYDLGSGLLRRPKDLSLEDEPDVAGALADGADIVAFSCDKLLGGPQAGIVAGRGGLISCMARSPLMRALRVGKLTLAGLSAACRHYLRDEELSASNPTFAMLHRDGSELDRLAAKLVDALKQRGINGRTVESKGQCGGGSLPDVSLDSVAVEILPGKTMGGGQTFAERLFKGMLRNDRPVLGVLREGRILLDVLTVFDEDIPHIAAAAAAALEPGA